jgi:hypothetical protein
VTIDDLVATIGEKWKLIIRRVAHLWYVTYTHVRDELVTLPTPIGCVDEGIIVWECRYKV